MLTRQAVDPIQNKVDQLEADLLSYAGGAKGGDISTNEEFLDMQA